MTPARWTDSGWHNDDDDDGDDDDDDRTSRMDGFRLPCTSPGWIILNNNNNNNIIIIIT